jgi:hypothetical protein
MAASRIDFEQLSLRGSAHKVIQSFQPVLATLLLDELANYQPHLVAKCHLDMLLVKLLLRQPTLENCKLHVKAGYRVHLNETLLLERMAPIRIYFIGKGMMRFSA